jgi:hypothetical protein
MEAFAAMCNLSMKYNRTSSPKTLKRKIIAIPNNRDWKELAVAPIECISSPFTH